MKLTRDSRLSRAETSAALASIGCKMTVGTLQNYASIRRGPPYVRWGAKTVYVWGDVLDWAQTRFEKSHVPAPIPELHAA